MSAVATDGLVRVTHRGVELTAKQEIACRQAAMMDLVRLHPHEYERIVERYETRMLATLRAATGGRG